MLHLLSLLSVGTVPFTVELASHHSTRTQQRFVCDQRFSQDGAILPTICFCFYALPKYFGWPGEHTKGINEFPKLTKWFQTCRASDEMLDKVAKEVLDALAAWDEGGRWEKTGIVDEVKQEGKWVYP